MKQIINSNKDRRFVADCDSLMAAGQSLLVFSPAFQLMFLRLSLSLSFSKWKGLKNASETIKPILANFPSKKKYLHFIHF